MDPDGWKVLTAPWKVKLPALMNQPIGCLECRDTGYMGREGIYELLPLTDKIKVHVQADVNVGKLRISAMKEGMKTLRLSGAQKVGVGDTTIAEVLRVAPFSGVE
jgi:general secretion pathway protein E